MPGNPLRANNTAVKLHLNEINMWKSRLVWKNILPSVGNQSFSNFRKIMDKIFGDFIEFSRTHKLIKLIVVL